MPYPRFQMTIQALNNLGGTVEKLNMIDLAEKNAQLEHELSLNKLALQKTQTEQQGRLALLNADISARDRMENRKFREEQLAISKGHLTLAQEKEKADTEREKKLDAEKTWMKETGNFEALYRGSLQKQGLAPEQIDAVIKRFETADPYGIGKRMLAYPTTREKMYGLLDDLPRLIHEERVAQRLAGNTNSASAKAHAAIVKDFQSKAAYLTQHGIGPDTEMGRSLLAKAQKAGVDLQVEIQDTIEKDVDPNDPAGTINKKVKKPVWQAQDYDPDVNVSMFKENKFRALHEKNPWLTHVDFDTAEEAMNNIVLHPEQEGVILNGLYRAYFKDQGAPGTTRYNPKASGAQGQNDLSKQGGGVQGTPAPGGVDLAGVAGTSGGVPKLAWDAAKGVWRGLTAAEMAYRSGAGKVVEKAGELRNRAFPDLPSGGGEVFVRDAQTGKLRAATSQEAQPVSFLPQDERAWAERSVSPVINTLGAMLSVPTTMPVGSLPTRSVQWTKPIQTARTIGTPTMQANTYFRNQQLTSANPAQAIAFEEMNTLRPAGISDAARLPRMNKYAGLQFASGAEFPRSTIGVQPVEPYTPNFVRYGAPVPRALPQGQPRLALPPMRAATSPVPVETGVEFLPPEYLNYLERYRNAQSAYDQARNVFVPFEQ